MYNCRNQYLYLILLKIANIQLAECILLGLVCGLVIVSYWFFGVVANQL